MNAAPPNRVRARVRSENHRSPRAPKLVEFAPVRAKPRRFLRTAAAVLTLCLMLASPAAAQDADAPFDVGTPEGSAPSSWNWRANLAAAGDAVVLRPLSFLGLIIGSAAFVPAAIITAPNGRDGITEAYELLIKLPYDETFVRPLGEL